MLQLQAGFHDAELRHTERGLGDRVGKNIQQIYHVPDL